MSSSTEKILRLTFVLGTGTFGEGLGNAKVISGLRATVTVEKAGQPSRNKMRARVYGMLKADMDALTTLSFHPLSVRRNLIQIQAGDADADPAQLPVVFQGEITAAHASYQAHPDLYFAVEAQSGWFPAIKPATPKGVQGGAAAAQLMEQLAAQMGLAFEDAGVQAMLTNPYLTGTAYQQAQQVAQAAGIEWGIDDGVLFVAPRGQVRGGSQEVPLISAKTGMRSFPVYDSKGVKVTTLFNPGVRLGGAIKVESEVFSGPTVWRVNGLSHHLESVKPDGQWFSKIQAAPVGS